MKREDIQAFRRYVYEHFGAHGRHDLPWRVPEPDGSFDPYKILVSELMLQQTQVPRVIPKFEEFLHHFPVVQALADAPLGDVLRAWQGLGYNRRAKFLHQAAKMVVSDFGGAFPQNVNELAKLPGVGKNTAGAVYVYSFNEPAVFIETNIRTVFIHHFFKDQTNIPDSAILELVEKTLPVEKGKEQPEEAIHSLPGATRKTVGLSQFRPWYWALMDYGTYLKQTVGNLSRASKSYVRQPPLEGSRRQIRGKVLRLLAEQERTHTELQNLIDDTRLDEVLAALQREGMVVSRGNHYTL